MDESLKKLEQWLKEAKNICFLTGAGMSTESGIPDFRSQNGLWSKNLEFTEIVSRWYFEESPDQFWRYFKEIFRTKLLHNYEPNRGHYFLAGLEKLNKQVSIITQNIDGLHQEAGSSTVYEIHGSIRSAACPECGRNYNLYYINSHEVPLCDSHGGRTILKPDVVLFGDAVHHLEEALDAALQSDLFIVLGSSLQVTPINQIPQLVSYKNGIRNVIINLEETIFDDIFDLVIHKKIGDAVSQVNM